MDGPTDYHTKWSQSDSESQTSYGITYMWNLRKSIQMNLLAEQKQLHRFWKMNLWLPKGMGGREGWNKGLGLAYAHCSIWNDWQTGPTV